MAYSKKKKKNNSISFYNNSIIIFFDKDLTVKSLSILILVFGIILEKKQFTQLFLKGVNVIQVKFVLNDLKIEKY